MMSRDFLQYVYEIAFYPPAIHKLWKEIKEGRKIKYDLEEVLKAALSLHLALPEKGFQSKRALKKVALCQASAKSFGTETFIRNIAKHLGIDISLDYNKIPGGMIRDFKLPEFSHHRVSSDKIGRK